MPPLEIKRIIREKTTTTTVKRFCRTRIVLILDTSLDSVRFRVCFDYSSCISALTWIAGLECHWSNRAGCQE